MVAKQVYSILNDSAKQTFGKAALAQIDLTDVVALGKAVIDANAVDKFLGALVDRIGRTVNTVRSYKRKDLGIEVDALTYGAYLQRTYVEPKEAQDDPAWNLPADGTGVSVIDVSRPTVKAKFFTGVNTSEVQVTIPDFLFETAFTSEAAVAAFISSIYTAMENSIEVYYQNQEMWALQSLIGEKVKYAGTEGATGVHVINLLKEYNTEHTSTLTAADVWDDYEFLQFATQRIINLKEQMTFGMTSMYNNEQFVRNTSLDDLRIFIHSQFASALDVYLRSTVFHNELVTLDGYRTLPYWQAPGTDYSRDNSTTVNIKTPSGTVVNQSGVVGVLFDKDALFLLRDMPRTKSFYNPHGEYLNNWWKMSVKYGIDLSFSAVVLIIADYTTG